MRIIPFLFFLSGCLSTPKIYKTVLQETFLPSKNSAYLMYATAKSRKDFSLDKIYPVDLIDSQGRIIHSWNAGCPLFSAKAYKNMELGVLCFHDLQTTTPLPGGTGGEFKLLDRNSLVLTNYFDILLHHSFERKQNNFFTLQNRALSRNEKKKFKLTSTAQNIWVERIVEINEDAKPVWNWDFILNGKKELFQRIKPEFNDITHANSIHFYEKNSLSKNPILLVSFRNLSTFVIIDYQTKDVLWISPAGAFDFQHDVSFIDPDTILVFNNSPHDDRLNSKIQTINVKSNAIRTIFTHSYFSVPTQGAVQFTQERGYLITNSLEGFGFELDSQFRYVFSVFNKATMAIDREDQWMQRAPIFKINKYILDDLE